MTGFREIRAKVEKKGSEEIKGVQAFREKMVFAEIRAIRDLKVWRAIRDFRDFRAPKGSKEILAIKAAPD